MRESSRMKSLASSMSVGVSNTRQRITQSSTEELSPFGVWFGNGNFSQTVNLAVTAADFADTDCNAANASSVVAAMHGMSALPPELVPSLNDRVRADTMGGVALTPPVAERYAALQRGPPTMC